MKHICRILFVMILGVMIMQVPVVYGAHRDDVVTPQLVTVTSFGDLLFVTDDHQLVRVPLSANKISEPISFSVVDGVSDVMALSQKNAGSTEDYIIQTDGSVWAIISGYGAKPVKLRRVEGLDNCIEVYSGKAHTIALTANGSVYAWGNNDFGQLGDGTFASRDMPQMVPNLYNIVDIAAGAEYCMALDNLGQIYTWGNNYCGQLGDWVESVDNNSSHKELPGQRASRPIPYRIPDVNDIIQVACLRDRSFVLRNDGLVTEWGGTESLSPYVSYPKPQIMKELLDICQMSIYDNYAVALSSSGELWHWGFVNIVPDGGNDRPSKMVSVPNAIRVSGGRNTVILTEDADIWQGIQKDTEIRDSGMLHILSWEQLQGNLPERNWAYVYKPATWAEGEIGQCIAIGLLPEVLQTKYAFNLTREEMCVLAVRLLEKKYDIGSEVIMKKDHACKTNLWTITRVGADIKIKCINCNRDIMMPRIEFNKKLKKVINKE